MQACASYALLLLSIVMATVDVLYSLHSAVDTSSRHETRIRSIRVDIFMPTSLHVRCAVWTLFTSVVNIPLIWRGRGGGRGGLTRIIPYKHDSANSV